ncbi:MAG: hypothetical protein ACE5OZ_24790 [Candidatus Heimdallarchaeota archaeon]
MTDPVTIAKMVLLAHDQPITLPADFLASLRPKEEGAHAIMILAPSTKIARIIPTKSPEVLKVAIEIGELSPEFLQELGLVLMHAKIKTLYSTGLCFTQETCVYEGYIDASEVHLPEEQLEREFSNIKGVAKVTINLLKMK